MYVFHGSLREAPQLFLMLHSSGQRSQMLFLVSAWSHSPTTEVNTPSVVITTGTTAAFTFHIYLSSSFSPQYFSHFSCSFLLMLRSPEISTSITTALLSDRLASFCIWKSNRSTALSFSHFDLGFSSTYSAQMLHQRLCCSILCTCCLLASNTHTAFTLNI